MLPLISWYLIIPSQTPSQPPIYSTACVAKPKTPTIITQLTVDDLSPHPEAPVELAVELSTGIAIVTPALLHALVASVTTLFKSSFEHAASTFFVKEVMKVWSLHRHCASMLQLFSPAAMDKGPNWG
jgi:hypothetical protein